MPRGEGLDRLVIEITPGAELSVEHVRSSREEWRPESASRNPLVKINVARRITDVVDLGLNAAPDECPLVSTAKRVTGVGNRPVNLSVVVRDVRVECDDRCMHLKTERSIRIVTGTSLTTTDRLTGRL